MVAIWSINEVHALPISGCALAPLPADVDRFMSFVDVLPFGCWYWTGARSRGKGNRKYYGSFWYRGRVMRAHRFSCEQIKRMPPLPAGMHRDHLCAFSMCVNPDHLEFVTREMNQERKMARLGARVAAPVIGDGWAQDFLAMRKAA